MFIVRLPLMGNMYLTNYIFEELLRIYDFIKVKRIHCRISITIHHSHQFNLLVLQQSNNCNFETETCIRICTQPYIHGCIHAYIAYIHDQLHEYIHGYMHT